jgi:hypothetical protein
MKSRRDGVWWGAPIGHEKPATATVAALTP